MPVLKHHKWVSHDAFRIAIEDYRVTLESVASLTDNSRGVIYDRDMFIVLTMDKL